MKILITGITGMVGSHLAEYVLKQHPGVEVHGMVRWRSPLVNIAEIQDRVQLHLGDLKDLNSLIHVNKDPALAAAAEIDSWSRPGPLPLAGLPIVVKDNINTADMPTSGGTPALENAKPTSVRNTGFEDERRLFKTAAQSVASYAPSSISVAKRSARADATDE